MKTDEELVRAARAGDGSAPAELIRRHAGRAYAASLAMVGNPDDAEDLAQEALLKAVTDLGRLRDGSRFGSWLVSIARNCCLDHLRRHRRRRELLEEHVADRAVAEDPGTPPADTGEDLQQALARLPDQHRLPLMLFYFDGRSTAGVAAALDISRGAACTRLSRARRELRQLLEASHD